MKNKWFILFTFIVMIGVSTVWAQSRGRPITLVGFGMPINAGGYGDNWHSTWSADNSLIIANNDGFGILGRSRNSIYSHCVINQLPASLSPENPATLANTGDGRRVIHPVNANDFTARYRTGTDATGTNWNMQNRWWYSYLSDIYEVDGVLYLIITYSYQDVTTATYLTRHPNLMRSLDGGRTWENFKGQIDTPTAPTSEDSFFQHPGWDGNTQFVKYGRGGVAPNVDRAQEYVYIFSWMTAEHQPPHGGQVMARIKLSDLKEWKTTPDGNGDNVRNKLEYLTLGTVYTDADARAGLDNRYWTTDWRQVKSFHGGMANCSIVYNETLGRYFSSNYQGDAFIKPIQESRLEVLQSTYPWGPWTTLIKEHVTAKTNGNLILNVFTQKYTSPDGYKMWMTVNGAHRNDSLNNEEGYILKFMPVFLTSEPAQTIMATDASRVTANNLSQQTHNEHEWDRWRYGEHRESSTGYGGFTADGSSLAFTVNAPVAGDYIVNFRYRTEGSPRWTNIAAYRRAKFPSVSLYVNNNKAKQLRLDRSIQWFSQWTEMSIFLRLNAGNNTITFQRDRGDNSNSVVISSLTYARYTGTEPLPLDNVSGR